MATSRTPEEIRASIEANRAELAHSLERLRGEVTEVTDWRKQIVLHQKQVLIGAAAAGFVLGGGIAGIVGVFRRPREVPSHRAPARPPAPASPIGERLRRVGAAASGGSPPAPGT